LDPARCVCYARSQRLIPARDRYALFHDLAGGGRYSGGKLLTRIPIDPDTIRALAAVLVETGLTEIEIADKDSRIRVVRGGGVATTVLPVAAAVAPAVPVQAAAAQDAATHPGAVLSPMVGVAYLAPEPGAPVFVSVGQEVAAGQTLLLIEAMKTFNQIKAPKAGTVAAILVQSGAPVEYGEVLIVLE
jgi:acetyl-CoA carboxylase biotin carboxyl carrier protein